MKIQHVRNFSIIAHIDHGKSTLSDRIIQVCGGNSSRKIINQVLDSMDLERERGITIKSQSVRLSYKSLNGKIYQLNLIDTPGHIDFSYEVSRSLAACEGALLLIDASQGIEARTLSNYYTAIEMNLKVIPIINKIDLVTRNLNLIDEEFKNIFGMSTYDVIRCSAKTGLGVRNIIENLIEEIPAPKGDPGGPLQALIIDSWFDNYLGVVSLVRIKNGTLQKGDKIKVMSSGQLYNVDRLGIFTPKQIDCQRLNCGEVGWLVCSIRDIHAAPVGDTLTGAHCSAEQPLPGFKKAKPQLYASLFSTNPDDYESFRNALGKLSLNDPSLFYAPETSTTLGFGFRCGFLGLLHMEIIQARLEREYDINLIITSPTVIYEVELTNGNVVYVDSPLKLPEVNNINEFREPVAKCNIVIPKEYLGDLIALCVEKRGVQVDIIYRGDQVLVTYEIPMSEVVLNFFDRLQSLSHGYASLDYDFIRFQKSDIVRVDVLINGNKIDVLSLITHRSNALRLGREIVSKMKDLISRHHFEITIQAAIGTRIIARSIVKQLRKNVLAKCYGGDVSRKKKLLQKQKEGKKHMKQIGNIKLPKEAFLAIFYTGKNN